MTATKSSSAVPTGGWGRPPRLRVSGDVVDLRELPDLTLPAGERRAFQPTPPPPPPPGRPQRSRPHRSPSWSRVRRSWIVELTIAAVILVTLALVARPPTPAPLSPEARWAATAGRGIDSLAADLADVGRAPDWTPSMADRLVVDVARVRAAGPPPGRAREVTWQRAIQHVTAGIRAAPADPAGARSLLQLAGVELTQLGTAAHP